MPHLRWSQAWLLGLGTLILWFLTLRFPIEGVPPDLDPTWSLLLALGFADGIQAGKDLVFTYGPLAYLMTPDGPFVEDTFWIKVVSECVIKALIAFCLMRFTLSLDNRWIRLAAFVSLILLTPWTHESIYFLVITAGCLSAIARPEDRLVGVLVAALIAPLGLAKFTLGAMGLPCIALVTLAKLFQGQRWTALWPLLAFAASTVVAWLAAGQSLGNLPLFVKGSLEISSGYNESMLWLGIPQLVTYAIAALLLWVTWIFLAGAISPRSAVRWASGCLLLVPALLCWKAGFVRPDAKHAFIFFSVMAILPLWGSVLVTRTRGVRFAVLLVLGISVIGLSWRAIHVAGRPLQWSTRYLLDRTAMHVLDSGKTLWQPRQTYATIQADLQVKRAANQLPRIREIIGKATVDEIPHTASILYLNDLTIRHRPVIQSYSAYTPYLQTLNGEFFESGRAPAFVLLKPEEIDYKVPLLADSQTYRVLLQRYSPVAFERGWLLLKRRERSSQPSITGKRRGTAAASGTGKMDAWIPLPQGEGIGELSIHLDPSTYGRILTLLYRPSILWMDVRRANGMVTTYRSPIPMMRLPFVVDPTVTSASAFLDLFGARFARHKSERVVAFRLRPSDGNHKEYAAGFEWTFDRFAAPLSEGVRDGLRQEVASGEFPLLPLPLVTMAPRWSFRTAEVEGKSLLMSHPVSRLALEAPRGDYRFRASFGLDPRSYATEAGTDGVVFRVSQSTQGGETLLLFERHLDPVRVVGDRGFQRLDIPVTWETPGLLILETLPHKNAAWDWAWWSQMSLDAK